MAKKAKKNKKQVEDRTFSFKDDETGGVYKHTGKSVRWKGKVYSAADAQENPELLAHLVSTNSRVLAVIEEGVLPEPGEAPKSVDARLDEIQATLDEICSFIQPAPVAEPEESKGKEAK
jgi:hypothetical protein